MNQGFGILSAGAYLPRRRLQRSSIHAANTWFAPNLRGLARGEKAIANWDEDSVTLAVDAGRNCLAAARGVAPDSVSLASTSLPFADRLNAGIAKEAMNLTDETAAFDVSGSLRAGSSALLQALLGRQTQLCLASDTRKARPGSEGEMNMGDGAAAILVGKGSPIATLRGTHSVTVDFVDHFRAAGEDFDYDWEKRWIRDAGVMELFANAVQAALHRFGVKAGDIDHVLIPLAGRSLPPKLTQKLGVRPDAVADTLFSSVGYTGAAHATLMLASALEKAGPGETILLATFAQGVDVLLFETTDDIASFNGKVVAATLADREEDNNYHRYLFHRGLLSYEKGQRAEFDEKMPGTALSRERKSVLGLIGGRCTETGTVQFPKTDISVAQNARTIGTQEDYPLANKTATITTFTADRLAYSPDPPTYYGMIDFKGGGRMVSEFTGVTDDDVAVGREMRMVFRIKARDEQRGFVKYFWKATPVRGETQEESA